MPTLLKYEKHHYIEKRYTELYANLTTATQLLNENPVEFALRCIDSIKVSALIKDTRRNRV